MVARGPDDATAPPSAASAASVGARRFGARREALLEAVRAAPDGIGIKDLAAGTGVHENTVRFHLERLVDEGVVEGRPGRSEGPGRPPLVFVPRTDHARENYELMARVLAGHLEDQVENPAELARQAGQAWGRAWGGHGIREDGWAGALDRLGRALAAAGFAPAFEPGPVGDEVRVRVHHCPFLALAREGRDVPCGVHLGMMEGVLGGAGQEAEVSLEPFATESTCLAVLSRRR
ncbi:MAG: helix-turn-helix domain-containing protein [Actinomycetales bacterium]|nr:helix-turn-helix domain-containing protein [Actinomycetales bacterium]